MFIYYGVHQGERSSSLLFLHTFSSSCKGKMKARGRGFD